MKTKQRLSLLLVLERRLKKIEIAPLKIAEKTKAAQYLGGVKTIYLAKDLIVNIVVQKLATARRTLFSLKLPVNCI